MNKTRCLKMIKEKEHYIVRYSEGRESEVIDALANMARDISSNFDWYDAAVLSYALGKRLESKLKEL